MRENGVCSVTGCGRISYRRGRCSKHYRANLAATGPQRSTGNLLPLVADAGVSYRQIDFWCRTGRITLRTPAQGSGTRRMVTAAEAAAIKSLAHEIADIERRLTWVRSGRFFADRVARFEAHESSLP